MPKASLPKRRAVLRWSVRAAALSGVMGIAPRTVLSNQERPKTPPGKTSALDRTLPGTLVDRAAVRFSVPEGGGRERPFFIYERELAFEARLVALADSSHRTRLGPYRRHHLQAAMERHIAESLLAAHTIDPEPREEQIGQQMEEARQMLLESVGGEEPLIVAALAEGLDSLELRRLLRRRALASLYLDRMVAPMLTPSLLELRRAHRRGEGPMADRPFSEAETSLRRWYVARSLKKAVTTYYQNARARLLVELL